MTIFLCPTDQSFHKTTASSGLFLFLLSQNSIAEVDASIRSYGNAAQIRLGCVQQLVVSKEQPYCIVPSDFLSLSVNLSQFIRITGMETVIQKGTELGVETIVPVFMDRTVVSEKGNMEKKLQRWQKIAAEAAKQCRRGIVPEVEPPVKTAEMIKRFSSYDAVIFPYENEENTTMKKVLRDLSCSWQEDQTGVRKKLAVVIGPEGGFSDSEAGDIEKSGAMPVSLGKTILRTETAGMAAVAMVMYELEMQ